MEEILAWPPGRVRTDMGWHLFFIEVRSLSQELEVRKRKQKNLGPRQRDVEVLLFQTLCKRGAAKALRSRLMGPFTRALNAGFTGQRRRV